MGTSVGRASHHQSLYSKFRSFPGFKADGMNVFQVRETLKVAKEYSILNGPMFVELETYRYQGHSMSDPGVTYRKKEEVSNIRETRDCIDYIKNIAISNSIANEKELKEIDKAVKAEVEADVERAKADPFPESDDLYDHVYAHNEQHYVRGVELKTSKFADFK